MKIFLATILFAATLPAAVYQYTPALNLDNVLGSFSGCTKAGVAIPFWQVNGPIASGATVSCQVAVSFFPFFASGTQLQTGELIEGAPVAVSLNYKKIWVSGAGVEITGTPTAVTNAAGYAPISFTPTGPHGASVVVDVLVGSENYVFFEVIQ